MAKNGFESRPTVYGLNVKFSENVPKVSSKLMLELERLWNVGILEMDRISKHVKTNVKSKTNLHSKPRVKQKEFRFTEDPELVIFEHTTPEKEKKVLTIISI